MSEDLTTTNQLPPAAEVKEPKAGYMVLRLRPGEGLIIGEIEIRISLVNGRADPKADAQIAVRAPKNLLIRRVR